MGPAQIKLIALRVARTARDVLNLDYALRLPPWSRLPDRDGTVSELRREALPQTTSPVASILVSLHGLYWPIRATVDATTEVLRHGSQVKALCGTSRRRQWRQAMGLAHTLNYSPRIYYLYGLWDPSIHQAATEFLQPDEMSALQIRTVGRTSVLDSKERFEEICAAAQLPTPPTVATISPWHPHQWTNAERRLPPRDLFIKPVDGKQGWGCERWLHDPATERWRRGDLLLTDDELVDRLANQTWASVIQHALVNHEELARYCTTTLSTFRVMTYREPGQSAWPIAVALKIPRDGADVDNLHVGGYVCGVDIETGRLTAGRSIDLSEGPHRTHADSGEVMEGATITVHRDVIALTLRAHEALDLPRSVGWDVAMTPTGPILVEGNARWAVSLYHMPYRRGLDERFAEAYLDEVRATPMLLDSAAK